MRRLGWTSARVISSASLVRAISRLRACDRVSSHWMMIAPSLVQRRPANRFSLFLTESGKEGERAASNLSSTAVETLFTFCPPGPEERTKLSVISQSCRVISSVMRNIGSTITGTGENRKGRPCGTALRKFRRSGRLDQSTSRSEHSAKGCPSRRSPRLFRHLSPISFLTLDHLLFYLLRLERSVTQDAPFSKHFFTQAVQRSVAQRSP